MVFPVEIRKKIFPFVGGFNKERNRVIMVRDELHVNGERYSLKELRKHKVVRNKRASCEKLISTPNWSWSATLGKTEKSGGGRKEEKRNRTENLDRYFRKVHGSQSTPEPTNINLARKKKCCWVKKNVYGEKIFFYRKKIINLLGTRIVWKVEKVLVVRIKTLVLLMYKHS